MWSLANLHSDLSTLNRLIRKYEIPVQQEHLYTLESSLQNRNIANNDVSYIISDVEFELLETISSTIPREVEGFSFFLSINFFPDFSKNFHSQDPFYNHKITYKSNTDPINSYSMQLVIVGYSNSHDNDLYNSWHLDRHITGGGTSKVTHPFYHFQNGGNKIEELNDSFKAAVFTGAPRIPHPPMDLFLGFHFILTNFFNLNSFRNIANFLVDDEYVEIIERAQNRLWKPYYSAFNGANHSDYSISSITPLYTAY